jgi:amino acid transporter
MSQTLNQYAPGRLRRDARIVGLLFAGAASIIGSGWLFGAFHAAKIAGPLSIWSWVLGGWMIVLIALRFAPPSSSSNTPRDRRRPRWRRRK